MPMHLKDLNTAPPGSWRYQQPQTGFWMTGITFEQLIGRIAQHRRNNNIPAISDGYPTLANEILDVICSKLSEVDQRRLCVGAKPLPWPVFLLPMKLLAQEGDRGLGDIVARIIGPAGGDAFKEWYKTTFGEDCGCHARQDHLNYLYPIQN